MKRFALCVLFLAVPVWAHEPPRAESIARLSPRASDPQQPAKEAPAAESASQPAAIRGELTVAPYKLVRQSAANVPDKAGVLWRVRPLDDRNEVDWASKQNGRSIEWVAPPGRYRVELYVVRVLADGTPELDLAETMVTIGDAVPGPGPGPGPPSPPQPPAPSDQFQLALQKAYNEDGTTNKSSLVDQLVALYKLASATTVRDPNLTTNSALIDEMRRATAKLNFTDATLAKVRRAIADEWNTRLPTQPNTPLDAALRERYALTFAEIAGRLGGLKR